jgi:hypothetical protein
VSDDGPGPGPTNKVDILFVVDTTPDLAAYRGVPGRGFLQALQAGAGSPDLHLGIVSANLGAGQRTDVSGCQVGGDQGILQHETDLSHCAAGLELNPDDHFLVYSAGPPRIANFSGDLETAVACFAHPGASDCGFRQPLASAMEALRGCDTGNCNQPLNAGFLRPDAFLALVVVSFWDDGSAPPDSALWDPNGVCGGCDYCWFRYAVTCDGGDPGDEPGPRENCAAGSWDSDPFHQLYPVEDLAAFFKGLKPDPRKVYVAVTSTAPDPIEVGDDQQGCPYAGVGCTIAGVGAFSMPPGARLSAFAQLFDADRARFQSSCDYLNSNGSMERVGSDIAGLINP